MYIHTHFQSCTTETGRSLTPGTTHCTRLRRQMLMLFENYISSLFYCFCQNKLYAQSQQEFAVCSLRNLKTPAPRHYLLLISLVAAACTTNSNGCTPYWWSRDGPSPSLAPAEVAHSIRPRRHARHLVDGGLDSGSLDTISANLAFRCRKSFTFAAQILS